MTVSKEDFATTIKQKHETLCHIAWYCSVCANEASCKKGTKDKLYVAESVVLDAYAQSQRDRNQQLQQLLKEFPALILGHPADFSRKDTLFEKGYAKGFYTAVDAVEKWKVKFEAFLKATTTEETTTP